MDTSKMKGSSMPVWDRKFKTCPRYLDQIKAFAEYYNCFDALDSVKVQNCPTKIQFDAIAVGTTDPMEIARLKIYKANK